MRASAQESNKLVWSAFGTQSQFSHHCRRGGARGTGGGTAAGRSAGRTVQREERSRDARGATPSAARAAARRRCAPCRAWWPRAAGREAERSDLRRLVFLKTTAVLGLGIYMAIAQSTSLKKEEAGRWRRRAVERGGGGRWANVQQSLNLAASEAGRRSSHHNAGKLLDAVYCRNFLLEGRGFVLFAETFSSDSSPPYAGRALPPRFARDADAGARGDGEGAGVAAAAAAGSAVEGRPPTVGAGLLARWRLRPLHAGADGARADPVHERRRRGGRAAARRSVAGVERARW